MYIQIPRVSHIERHIRLPKVWVYVRGSVWRPTDVQPEAPDFRPKLRSSSLDSVQLCNHHAPALGFLISPFTNILRLSDKMPMEDFAWAVCC